MKIQHKCTVCKKVYEEGEDILNGCSCGNKLFYFINTKKKKDQDLQYLYEIEDDAGNEPLTLDLENVHIIENGKYEIDINSLLNSDCQEGLVYKYGEGKYSIDLDNIKKKK